MITGVWITIVLHPVNPILGNKLLLDVAACGYLGWGCDQSLFGRVSRDNTGEAWVVINERRLRREVGHPELPLVGQRRASL